jgi:hypothetical protein
LANIPVAKDNARVMANDLKGDGDTWAGCSIEKVVSSTRLKSLSGSVHASVHFPAMPEYLFRDHNGNEILIRGTEFKQVQRMLKSGRLAL